GTVCPLQGSGPEVSEQQRNSALDLVGDVFERGVRRLVVAACRRRVRDAPVRGDRRVRELRADLPYLAAERNAPVETATGEEREAGVAEEDTATEEIGAVVDVATVGGASPRAHDPGVAELRQVVGDQVLRLPYELHELAHAPIAAPELADQLPLQWIAEHPEDLRRLCQTHTAITSALFDVVQVECLRSLVRRLDASRPCSRTREARTVQA